MTARFDVCCIGNALVDVLAYEDDGFVARNGLDPGVMNMMDAARSDEIYAQMGPATEASGGSAAEHRRRARVVRWHRRLHRPGRRRHVRQGVHPRPAEPRRPLRFPRRERRIADWSLPRDRRARRRAHDVHASRRREHARTRRHRPQRHRPCEHHVSRGLSLGRAADEGRDPPRRGDGARRGTARRAHAVGSVLCRPASARVPRPGREPRRHPLRERGRDHDALRRRRFRRGVAARARPLRSRSFDAGRAWVRSSSRATKYTSSMPRPLPRWSTRPAPATRTRPGSCSVFATVTTSRPAAAWAPSAPPK